MTPIGIRLKYHRHERGLTQSDLAKIAGIAARTISAIESGRSAPPSSELLSRIATSLCLSLQQSEELKRAAQVSRRQLRLPAGVSPIQIALANKLVERLSNLSPGQCAQMESILNIAA